MILIGILGGVASGKSEVSNRLRSLGAEVLDADQAGHRVLREAEVQRVLRQRWGERILDAAGEVDRRKIAEIVFAGTSESAAELKFLEQLTHPRIGRRLESQLAEMHRAGVQVAVLDAPVMLKAGWDRLCQRIVFVDTPQPVRLARARQRGWTESDFAAREAAQEPVEAKRKRADMTIDNSASREQLYAQVDRFWQDLLEDATQPPRRRKSDLLT
jgi:dephospho-CoA kinase